MAGSTSRSPLATCVASVRGRRHRRLDERFSRVGHCDGSDISVRSISGDVRLGLPSGIRVEADLSTVSGRAQLPEPAPTGGDRRPVRLMVKTVSGDIRLERSN